MDEIDKIKANLDKILEDNDQRMIATLRKSYLIPIIKKKEDA